MELIVTNDGSHSIYLPDLNETYHSKSGAISESEHVYIKYGLDNFIDQPELSILEIGLGTGLNALLTMKKCNLLNIKINYTSLEPFPLSIKIIEQLNYTSLLSVDSEDLIIIHTSPLNKNTKINNTFKHLRLDATFEKVELKNNFDLIYYDAFAPSKQSEIWEIDRIQKAYNLLKKGGILVTYCAQGQFKRNLKAVGFTVENKPGPHEKREITLGIKQ